MRSNTEGASCPFHPDDLVVWSDGTWATCEQFASGAFSWMSDDVERVRMDDADRLRKLGLAEFADP